MRSLQLVDLSLSKPEENLALDEALFRLSEMDATGAYLRFWESQSYFVVLGVSSRLDEDVDAERCTADGVPVLRRISGGGTVLLGPGCLNFTLVLPLARWPEMRRVESSYTVIVERTLGALGLAGTGLRGTCDLAVGERKFGGSAQKRSRNVILHQGTILYGFDLGRVPSYLREPTRRPTYRGGRDHLTFLTNVPVDARQIRRRLAAAWEARPVGSQWPVPTLDEYVIRYRRREWTARF